MEYKNKTDISPAILRILKKRGITDPADIEEYMSPIPKRTYDPFLMKGMDEASDMIIEYARGGRRICVYGDYDCDGVTSVSLMMTLLGELAADAWYYIPSRFEEGYGLNKKAIDRIAERGTQLIITVDNGCVAFDEVAYIKEKGMAVIVTDHHNVGTQSPDCIMLDPKQTDDDYPFSFLCGCGVAFKLAQAVTRKTGISKKKLNSLGIFTIGQIANTPVDILKKNLGKWGQMLHSFANGNDTSTVALYGETSPVKSIGNSTTSPRDLKDITDVKIIMGVLADSVARRMREQGLSCMLVSITVRDNSLCSFTRQKKLLSYTDITSEILSTGLALFKESYSWKKPIRSLGLSVSELTCKDSGTQLSLFEDNKKRLRQESLDKTTDALKNRFGNFIINPAVMLKDTTLSGFNPKADHTIHPVALKIG